MCIEIHKSIKKERTKIFFKIKCIGNQSTTNKLNFSSIQMQATLVIFSAFGGLLKGGIIDNFVGKLSYDIANQQKC